MTGDGENGHSVASRTWCVDRHGTGQCLGAVEVEARENPSGLAAANSRAASRSRIYVSSCDCRTGSSQPVAIGRGPYTSTHDPKRTLAARLECDGRYTSRIQNLLPSRLPGVTLAWGHPMTRREFVELLSGTVAAWPFVAHAQQATPRHIGVLGADATVWNSWTVAFVARLRELGWIAGDTIDVEYRWAGGSSRRVSDFAVEFLRRHVDVIVTYGAAAAAVKQATTTIPIVLAVASDPVALV